MTCWRGATRRVLAALAVLVAALPSSAAAGAAAASPPPPTDMSLLVARLGRLEAAVRGQARETREARADARALERRVGELEAEREDASARRRVQQPAPQPPGNASLVHLHHATVSYASPSVGTHSSDGDGHRRAQQTSCGPMRFMSIQTVCCDEPAEDCSSGAPASCNAGCAAVFLPFMTDCSVVLGAAAAQYQPVVVMCRAAAPGGGSTAGGSSLAHEFNLVCSGSTVDSCVPVCSAALRGDLLLMNLNGEDSKYSCELHHGLHSWVGAATDGGYLGSDVRAFVSAVLSGAAGYYALALTGDAGVGTDLVIRPGQDVHVAGGGFNWGAGGLLVSDQAKLSVSNLLIPGYVAAGNGGELTLRRVTVAGTTVNSYEVNANGAVTSALPERDYGNHAQCLASYSVLNQAWRRRSVGTWTDPNHETAPCGTNGQCTQRSPPDCAGQGTSHVTNSPPRSCYHCDYLGDRWYRIQGPAGNALSTQHAATAAASDDGQHCGSQESGWMTDTNLAGQSGLLSRLSLQTGTYPNIRDGVVQKYVCFGGPTSGGQNGCDYGYSHISVINCGGFFLWKLPDAPRCSINGGGIGGHSDFGNGGNAIPQTYCTVDVPLF
eukprot:SAG25_NODE_102_length_15486_cov_22.883278_3_plen_607_part_00